MIHERKAMNKWMITRTPTIKDIRLKKKQMIVTLSFAKRKSTMKYARRCG